MFSCLLNKQARLLQSLDETVDLSFMYLGKLLSFHAKANENRNDLKILLERALSKFKMIINAMGVNLSRSRTRGTTKTAFNLR